MVGGLGAAPSHAAHAAPTRLLLNTLRMYQVVPELSKDFLLQYVTQEGVMQHYLGVPVQTGKKFRSPLRSDKHPTCTFSYSPSGVLTFCDWAGYFRGDCFDLVRHIYNCDFYTSMQYIARDLGVFDIEPRDSLPAPNYTSASVLDKSMLERRSGLKIRTKPRAWAKEDIERWTNYGWTKELVDRYKIYPLKHAWLEDESRQKIVYTHSADDPCYAYWFAPYEYKLYFPNRAVYRFMSNSNCIQGYSQLPESGDILIITKSLKDIGPLVRTGFSSVAPQAESIMFGEEIMEELESRFSHVYTLMDHDEAGIRLANRFKRTYNVPPLFFTRGRWNTHNFGAKDASEFYEKHQSIPLLRDVILQMMDYSKRYVKNNNVERLPSQRTSSEGSENSVLHT